MTQQVIGIHKELLDALQAMVTYIEQQGDGRHEAARRNVLNQVKAVIKRAVESSPLAAEPSREHIRAHTFAAWVMGAHKDAIYAVDELEATATRYGAMKSRMGGVAADGKIQEMVTVKVLIDHLRTHFRLAMGRAAAAQHVDPDPVRGPLGNGPCGCTVRE